ncbi:MAG: hypothetical protein EA360_01190 [Balneolaceae bacterium]|nr:MAG: hypothetical protein EA360_01190 [Balneolaceae bacterium]
MLPGIVIQAQSPSEPLQAFARSMILPGWGHLYSQQASNQRGAVHLVSEALLLSALVGIRIRSHTLEDNYLTLVRLRSGIDLTTRGRAFRLAVGQFNSLEEFNEYQLRSRNWHRLIVPTDENNWQWQSSRDREQFNRLRSDRDRLLNQIPALIGMMALNRVSSALSAYRQTKESGRTAEVRFQPLINETGEAGALAKLTLHF